MDYEFNRALLEGLRNDDIRAFHWAKDKNERSRLERDIAGWNRALERLQHAPRRSPNGSN